MLPLNRRKITGVIVGELDPKSGSSYIPQDQKSADSVEMIKTISRGKMFKADRVLKSKPQEGK